MTIDLSHVGVGDPDWAASYDVKALMGDLTLRDCEAPLSFVEYDGDQRRSGPRPFVVKLSQWADWAAVPGGIAVREWWLVQQPTFPGVWFDHHDLLAVDDRGVLWHKRTSCGMREGVWAAVEAPEGAATWAARLALDTASTTTGEVHAFAVHRGRLWTRATDWTGTWADAWHGLEPWHPGVLFPLPVPIGEASSVTAVPKGMFNEGVADLAVTGTDGDVYLHRRWSRETQGLWEHLATDGFELAPGERVAVVGSAVVARSAQGGCGFTIRRPLCSLTHCGRTSAAQASGSRGSQRGAAGTDLLAGLRWSGRHGQHRPPTGPRPRRLAGHPCRRRMAAESDDPALLGRSPRGSRVAGGHRRRRHRAALHPRRRGVAGGWLESRSRTACSRAVVAVSRVTGQVEVLAATAGGGLAWTWWS